MILFKLAYLNLKRNLRRTSIVLSMVAMGVSALFIFDGFITGIMNQYKDNTIHFKTGNGQINTKGYLGQTYEKPWEHWIEDAESLKRKLEMIPGVSYVFPRVDFYSVLTNGTVSVTGRGTGVHGKSEAEFFWSTNVVQGEILRDHPDGILIGVGLAKALNVGVGSRVTLLTNTIHGSLNGIDLQVVGIFHSGLKDADDSYFRIQIEQAFRLLDTKKIESIALGLHNDDDWPRIAKSVERQFPHLETTSFAVLDKVYYQHAVDWLGQQFLIIQAIIITIITLSIFNTMSFTVIERTQEIGNLRANGDSSFEVLVMLVSEAIVIGVAGALLGLLASWLMNTIFLSQGILMPPAPGLTRQFAVKMELRLLAAGLSGLVGIATCVVATCFAAWPRVRMPIGEALRHR